MYRRKINDSNYKIVGGQAYTEDNILVNNIFSNSIPRYATTAQISEYFQQFGEVSKVKWVGNNKSKKCFIDFADPKVAAKVLQNKNHIFMKRKLRLQACYSHLQPDGQKIIKQLTESINNESLTDDTIVSCSNSIELLEKPLILTLNDDCLEHICKQLTPTDQINFALTCQRFCNIFKMLASLKYSTLITDSFYEWTLWQIKIFLQIVGPQVKDLVIYFNENETSSRLKIATCIRFLASSCKNVEKLKIFSCDIESYSVRTLFENMKQVKELELFDINDNMINDIKSLKKLKSLSITNNLDITGKYIHLLCGLEKLCLPGCYCINPWNFRKICKNLTNLQYLDIRSCDQLKKEDFKHISEHLLELRTLKLSTNGENVDSLAKLPKLKHLEIYSVTGGFLKNLSKHQADQLEELKLVDTEFIYFDIASLLGELKKLKVLHCDNDAIDDKGLKKISQLTDLVEANFVNCKGISDNGVLELLKHCLKLKQLDLTKCHSITPDIISNIIKLLKEQRERWLRMEKLNIILTNTSSLESRVNEISLEDYSDVLKITLDKMIFGFLESDDDDEYYNYDDDDDIYLNYPFDFEFNSDSDDAYGYDGMFFDDFFH